MYAQPSQAGKERLTPRLPNGPVIRLPRSECLRGDRAVSSKSDTNYDTGTSSSRVTDPFHIHLCRANAGPEVGVPLPARRLCSIGISPSARLRRAVPGPTGRTGQRSAFPCLPFAPRPEGEGGESSLSHFPPGHAGSERSSLPLFFARSAVRPPSRIAGTMERRSPTGIARGARNQRR